MKTGEMIKIVRIQGKIRQEDLAKKLDVTKSYLSLVENGRKKPSLGLLKKISDALNIPFILFIKEKIDLPNGKNSEERKIRKKFDGLIDEAQNIFISESLKIKPSQK